MGTIHQQKDRLHQKRARQRRTGRRLGMDHRQGPEHSAADDTIRLFAERAMSGSSTRSLPCTRSIGSSFNDDKEGLLGIRVARWLESADEKGGTFTDANGRPTEVPASNTPGATGVYLTSEGKKGDQAWAPRPLVRLNRQHRRPRPSPSRSSTIPEIPTIPTYWHARGYGLFAANPLGPAHLRSQGASIELHRREESKRNLHLPHSPPARAPSAGRNEPRRRRIRGRIPLANASSEDLQREPCSPATTLVPVKPGFGLSGIRQHSSALH